VQFDAPPPPTAPTEMRESYYQTHAPEPPERGEFVVRTRTFEKTPTFTQRVMHLRNGTRIAYVEDLRPLVDENSDTAAAIAVDLDARGRADLTTGAGLAIAGVGVAVGAGLVSQYLLQPGLNNQGNELDLQLVAGAGAVVVGVLGGGAVVAWGLAIRDDEDDARTKAFKTFDASLRSKLALDAKPPPPPKKPPPLPEPPDVPPPTTTEPPPTPTEPPPPATTEPTPAPPTTTDPAQP